MRRRFMVAGTFGITATLLATLVSLTPATAAPTAPTTPSGTAISIASGYSHTLALLSDGTVQAWGDNYWGQLGNGTRTDSTTPVWVCAPGRTNCATDPTARLTGVTAIAAGGNRDTLARLWDGTVLAWGSNANGQLGDGTMDYRTTPVWVCAPGRTNCATDPTARLTDVTALSTGGKHNVAVRWNGAVVAWGSNEYGQLGNGTRTDSATPVWVCAPDHTDCADDPAARLSGVTTLGVGLYHTVAALRDGTVLAWGDNSIGQLGDGTKDSRTTPVWVCNGRNPWHADCANDPAARLNTDVIALSAGSYHTLALLRNGTVLAWGSNANGQLGIGVLNDSTIPLWVICTPDQTTCDPRHTARLTGVIALGAGTSYSAALRQDGTVLTWGSDNGGQLGNGGGSDRSIPGWVCAQGRISDCSTFPDSRLAGVAVLSAGSGHSAAILGDGSIVAWGSNDYGQLGNGTTDSSSNPVPVVKLD
jgi:alpha-tubulin suppressor-like RCC1 family protein